MQDVKTDRNKYIGGSDIPIIMGISSFKSRFDLLLEKAELKEDDFTGNEYTEYGNKMEPKIREYINLSLGKNYKEGKHIEDDIRIHTDGECSESILEIKTTSQIYNDVNEYKVYLVQLLFYMFFTKKNSGILAVYNRPDDFNEEFDKKRLQVFMISIDNYKDLIEEINEAVEKFKIDLEKVKNNPFITEEDLLPESLKELSELFILNKKRIEELEKENNKIISKLEPLFKKMGTNNITINDKKLIFVKGSSGKKTIVKSFNLDKFKEENDRLYNQYIEENEKIGKSSNSYIKISDIK